MHPFYSQFPDRITALTIHNNHIYTGHNYGMVFKTKFKREIIFNFYDRVSNIVFYKNLMFVSTSSFLFILEELGRWTVRQRFLMTVSKLLVVDDFLIAKNIMEIVIMERKSLELEIMFSDMEINDIGSKAKISEEAEMTSSETTSSDFNNNNSTKKIHICTEKAIVKKSLFDFVIRSHKKQKPKPFIKKKLMPCQDFTIEEYFIDKKCNIYNKHEVDLGYFEPACFHHKMDFNKSTDYFPKKEYYTYLTYFRHKHKDICYVNFDGKDLTYVTVQGKLYKYDLKARILICVIKFNMTLQSFAFYNNLMLLGAKDNKLYVVVNDRKVKVKLHLDIYDTLSANEVAGIKRLEVFNGRLYLMTYDFMYAVNLNFNGNEVVGETNFCGYFLGTTDDIGVFGNFLVGYFDQSLFFIRLRRQRYMDAFKGKVQCKAIMYDGC